jgi:4-oxalocrotonate tautomerase
MKLFTTRLPDGVPVPARTIPSAENTFSLTMSWTLLRWTSVPVTWVVVEEVKGGDWGIGGKALRSSDVKAVIAGAS